MSKKKKSAKPLPEFMGSLFTREDRYLIKKGETLFGKTNWDESEPPEDDDDCSCVCVRCKNETFINSRYFAK